jgi:hypothetical protein
VVLAGVPIRIPDGLNAEISPGIVFLFTEIPT